MVTEKCRLCLTEALEIQSIFDSQLYQSVPLSVKIAVCISLPITQEDPFPKFICRKCRMLVDQFYSFRESCMNNYIHLLGLECTRVTELDELITVSDISYDMTLKSKTIEPCSQEISSFKTVHDLNGDTDHGIKLSLENVSSDDFANDGNQLMNNGTNYISQERNNQVDTDPNNSENTLLEDITNYPSSDVNDVGNVEGKMTADNVVVEEDENISDCDTDVAYSEIEEIIEPDCQYLEPESIIDEVSGSPDEHAENTMYYGNIGIKESNLEEDDLKTLLNKELRFKCNNCLKVFLTSNDLNIHCEECQCSEETMDGQEDLSTVDEEMVVLGGIMEGMGTKEPLNQEGRARWGEKRKYPCDTCKKMFKTRAGLRNHVRIHTGERPYLCSLCTRSFSQKGALLNHERQHRGEWPYPCQHCGKGFFRPSDLEKHVRSHTNERPFLCSTCSKGFHQLSGLVVHERVHTGIRPYSCHMCDMRFSQLSNKYRHLKTHAGGLKPYDCNICHRKFADRAEMEMHRAVHQGAKPRICNYCNKGFRKPYELRDHLRRNHTNERPFTCQLCSKSFFVAHDLKNHLYIHTGERPFACTICSKTFTQAGNLKRHHSRHHPDPMALDTDKSPALLLVQQFDT